METRQDTFAGSGKTLALSVGAAALLGTLATSLFGRDLSKQEKAQQQLEVRLASLEDTARQSLDQLTTAVTAMQTQAGKKGGKAQSKAANVSRSARKAADEAAKAAIQRAKELEKEARSLRVAESAARLGTDVSSRANATAKAFSDRSAAVMAEAQAQVPGWRNKAAKSWADARQRSAGFAGGLSENAPDLSGTATKLAHDAEKLGGTIRSDVRTQAPAVKERAARAAHDVSELGKTYAAEARTKAPAVRTQVEGFVGDLTEQAKVIAPDLADRLSQAATRAGESAGALSHQVKDRAPSLLESVGQHLTEALEEAQKKARPLVDDALSQAAHVGTKFGEDVVPQVQNRAHDVTGRLGSQSHAASASLAALGKGATERLSHTTEVVEVRSKEAATAAGKGTMELGALIGWSAAAAGVVYITFLNDKQRARVKESGKRIAEEIGSVVRDIRGQDGQFS